MLVFSIITLRSSTAEHSAVVFHLRNARVRQSQVFGKTRGVGGSNPPAGIF